VARDLGGATAAELGARGRLYDEFMKFRFEATMLVYRDLYSLLGSYDLWRLKWDFDIGNYYNLWVEPYMMDLHLDPGWLETQLRQSKLVLNVLRSFSALFKRVEKHLDETGQLYRNNLGHFTGDFPTMECAVGLGTSASYARAVERTTHVLNLTRGRALELLGREAAGHQLPITHFLSGKPLL
jgi:hypothetical protein